MTEAATLHVEAMALRRMLVAIITAAGSEAEEAAVVADHLLEANLQGHDSHGIMLLGRYVQNVGEGRLNPNTAPVPLREEPSLALFDGGMGYGQRVGRETMAWAIATAKRNGHAVMGLRNTHHLGRIGTYAEQAAAEGLVSLNFVNAVSGPASVAPFGGSDGRFSTNPVCIGMPGAKPGDPPLILDFATSAIALGKCRVAFNAGKPVPEGALVDATGRPTTDPGVLYRDTPRGALQSFGAHKGYGLALMCELLAGAMLGGVTSLPNHDTKGAIVNGWLSIVLDPARFGDLSAFQQELAGVISHVKASPPADPDHPVLVAGEKERLTKAARLAGGIPVDATTWQRLLAAAKGLGVTEIAKAA